MAAPVWVLSVDLQAKTATFQSGMSEAAKSARGAFTEIKSGSSEMGGHVQTNMFASRHAIMAVTESLGVQMPRAITALITHIGPLGAALEAAFPFAAIGLAAVLLIEHLNKLHAEGVKLTEDQANFGTAVQNAFNSLDQKLLQSGIRADELRNDHLGALHLQLQLIDRQSMDELVETFGKVAKAADTVFADLKSHWYTFGDDAGGAKHAMDEFQNKYASLLSQGKAGAATDLLHGTLNSAQKVLAAMTAAKAAAQAIANKGGEDDLAEQIKLEQASVILRAANRGYRDDEVKAQQLLVDSLNDQVTVEGKIAAITKQDKGNASTATGKELSGLKAEADKQAAEHAQKMAELSLQIQREQANESDQINEASIDERLFTDLRFANEEYAIQLQASTAKIAALDRSGKDYNNQLKGLQDKEQELTLQHEATIGGLISKANEATARQGLQELQASERGKIDATESGSRGRLQAIDAALAEERAKGLEQTTFYRELVNERIQVERQADDEDRKLAAEAGKEAAANDQKMGELSLAATLQRQALLDSFRRVTVQQRLAEEIAASNAEFTLKDKAMKDEAAALDRGGKDYDNKLKAIQDKERQLVQEHENQITAIKDKALMDRNSKVLSGEARFQSSISSGLTEVLMGHKSFASMMNSLGNEVVSGMLQNAIQSLMIGKMTQIPDAARAARAAYVAGVELGGPMAPITGAMYGAEAFAAVMAFAAGTDSVPGVGHGDTVPAMLTPGEGVVPGGVMDGLRKMAASGTMGGGGATVHLNHSPTYHVQTIDGDGIRETLTKHSDEFARHVQGEIRKMNR